MEKMNINNQIEAINPESLIEGKHYKIVAQYTRGEYEGQSFEGEVKFLETKPDAEGNPMFRFEYTKKPEHFDEVTGGSTYVTNKEGLQWIKEL